MAELGAAWESHARKLRRVGWSWAEIAERLSTYYGFEVTVKTLRRVCRATPKGTARDEPPQERVNGERQGNAHDYTEGWLARNDPAYNEQSRGWITTKFDASVRTVPVDESAALDPRRLAKEPASTTGRAERDNGRARGDWSYRPGKAAPRQCRDAAAMAPRREGKGRRARPA